MTIDFIVKQPLTGLKLTKGGIKKNLTSDSELTLKGIITKGIGGFYYVKAENNKTYECKARGVFRKSGLTPLPGDNVCIKVIDENEAEGFLKEILPRKSLLFRPAVANVDQLIAVIAAKSPEPDLLLLDKLLITACKNGMKVCICINKIDLDPEKEYNKIKTAYEKAGYSVIAVSSKTGFNMDKILEMLSAHITVLAGQSGVGKSTILNTIIGNICMETGEISEKIMRGKHTTRHAQLFELTGGGYIVDTPGFSLLELSDIKYDELHKYYPDFNCMDETCRFRGCSHISEPGCIIKNKVENGIIDQERYQRYIQLYNTLKQARK